MRHAFLLSFTFDDGASACYAFTVSEACGQRIGMLDSQADEATQQAYSEWIDRLRETLEARYSSVHDASGTFDNNASVDGFCLYESTPGEAAEIAKAWHDAFVEQAGSEGGVSAMVCERTAAAEEGEDEPCSALENGGASDSIDEIERLLGLDGEGRG